jgi:hypothetical protein
MSFAISANAAESKVLAVVQTSGGLFPMPANGVQIMNDGRVLHFEGVQNRLIAKLTADRVVQLRKAINVIKPGKLVDPREGEPDCMDAPQTVYNVIKNGKPLTIGAREMCHEKRLEGTYLVDMIVDLLTGLDHLGRLE